jgi:hypothetical protein
MAFDIEGSGEFAAFSSTSEFSVNFEYRAFANCHHLETASDCDF